MITQARAMNVRHANDYGEIADTSHLECSVELAHAIKACFPTTLMVGEHSKQAQQAKAKKIKRV